MTRSLSLTWASRFLFLSAILWSILLLSGCTTAWTGEASNIIAVLIPAVQAILGLIAALGARIPDTAVQAVTDWGSQAQAGLQQIKDLIDQYNNAEANAKPGLLVEIQTAAQTIVNNLNSILPTLHVLDPATQQKVTAVANAVLAELEALLSVIPVLQGKLPLGHLRETRHALLDSGHFVERFNETMTAPTGDAQVDELTPEFTIGDKTDGNVPRSKKKVIY